MQQGPGVYDEYVVDWLYRPVPGAATPEDEVAELDRRIAARRSDPMCLYTPPPVAVALDPRSMPYNLGDDPVRAAAYEFANYAYVMKHADEWIGEEDADNTFRSLVQASVMNQLYYAFVSVSANLGGVYLNEKYEGDALPTYLSVPRDLQRRALRFMLERLEDMSWLDNERLNKDVVEVVSLGEYCRDMLSDVIFKSLSTLDLSASKSDDPYTQDDAMDDLYRYILRDVAVGRESTEANIAMQHRLLINIIRNAGVVTQTRRSAASASAFAGETLPDAAALSRLAKMARVFSEMTSDPVSGVLPMRSVAFLVRPAVDYKRYGMLLDMKKLYRNALGTSASERMKNHYRNAAFRPHCFFAYGYAWNFIVNFRIGLSTHIGSALQRGIHARFHQSGTMHRRPRHRARSPRRAHESAEMSTPMRRPMRCQRGVSP